MTYVLTRILPDGQEKTAIREHPRKSPAAMQAARSHHANTKGEGSDRAGIYEALMAADPGVTVGPFQGHCYRIDSK